MFLPEKCHKMFANSGHMTRTSTMNDEVQRNLFTSKYDKLSEDATD